MTSDLNTVLRRRILSSVDQFFQSRESFTVGDFEGYWSQLTQDVALYYQDGILEEDTGRLAYEVAGYIEILCEEFKTLDLYQLAWSDSLDKQHFVDSSSIPAESEECHISPAPYVKQAYEWLLQNLHNPYPSSAVRDEICAASGSQRKFIDGWFIEARKRIGWNDLRKKEGWFRTRKEMIDAATRHFVKPDDKRPLSPEQELEFVMLEDRAARMYGEKMIPSQLVTKLANSVKDMTPELKVRATETKRQERLKRRRVGFRAEDVTRERSKTPDDGIHSSSLRKRSASEVSEAGSEEYLNKRLRVESDASSSLPNPLEASTLLSLPSSSSFSSRKRRFSESGGSSSAKRTRRDFTSVGMRSVSDPSPVTPVVLESFPDLDNWFSNIAVPELTSGLLESCSDLHEGGGSLALSGGLRGSISHADLSIFNPGSFNMSTPELSPSLSPSDEDSESLFRSEEGASAPVTPTSYPVSLTATADSACSLSSASSGGAQPVPVSVSNTPIDDIDTNLDFTKFDPASFGLPSIDVPGLTGLGASPDPFVAVLQSLSPWSTADGIPQVDIVNQSAHALDSYVGQGWQYAYQVQQGADKVTPQSIMAGLYGPDDTSFSSSSLFGRAVSSGGQQRVSQQSVLMSALQWPGTVSKHLPMILPQLGMGF